MKIYVTPFKSDDLDHPGISIDSGFTSMSQVVESMGLPDHESSANILIYGPGVDRVLFSQLPFHIDAPEFKAYTPSKSISRVWR